MLFAGSLMERMVRQYGIISGRLNPDGSSKPKRHSMNRGMRYVSVTVSGILRQCGFKNNLNQVNPRSGRKVLVYSLDFKHRA